MPRDVELTVAHKTLRKIVEEAIENGDISLTLKVGGGGEPEPVAFTLDKSKYRLRLTDETELSVKVWIEPIVWTGRCNHTRLPNLPKASRCMRCGM